MSESEFLQNFDESKVSGLFPLQTPILPWVLLAGLLISFLTMSLYFHTKHRRWRTTTRNIWLLLAVLITIRVMVSILFGNTDIPEFTSTR